MNVITSRSSSPWVSWWLRLLVAVTVAVGLAGCGGTPPAPTATAIAPAAPRTPQPSQAPTASTVADSAAHPRLVGAGIYQLPSRQPAGPLLAQQIAHFETAKPGKVRVQQD